MAVPKSYNPDYLACRSDGHAWRHERTEVIVNFPGLVRRVLYCPTHQGWRHDIVNQQTGDVQKRRYVMPEGYTVVGQGRTPRREFRRVLLQAELKGVS